VTVEKPNTAQTSERGMASMPVGATPGVITGAAGATVTGAIGAFVTGAVTSGCVFAILAGAAGCGAGAGRSGRMLMRAVSFFGPPCAVEPG
jgi:hypothetical protein